MLFPRPIVQTDKPRKLFIHTPGDCPTATPPAPDLHSSEPGGGASLWRDSGTGLMVYPHRNFPLALAQVQAGPGKLVHKPGLRDHPLLKPGQPLRSRSQNPLPVRQQHYPLQRGAAPTRPTDRTTLIIKRLSAPRGSLPTAVRPGVWV